MSSVKAYLFGKFRILCGDHSWDGPEGCKAKELFSYLLVHRNIIQNREHLASILWEDSTASRSKKYLRQVLWQLHSACESSLGETHGRLLLISQDSIRINPEIDLWTDIAIFQQAFAFLRSKTELDEECVSSLRSAAQIYRGDLLEGLYQDWCLIERERLQTMYLIILDRLIGYCETVMDYEVGIDYCSRILKIDPARERTHQQMMRLYYLSGDRTAALRQFDRCLEALKKELDVRPTRSTLALCAQIRADQLDFTPAASSWPVDVSSASLSDVLSRLKQFQRKLADLQLALQQEIQIVERLSTQTSDLD
jgi:DNA-binding SARP family transcriptional activator